MFVEVFQLRRIAFLALILAAVLIMFRSSGAFRGDCRHFNFWYYIGCCEEVIVTTEKFNIENGGVTFEFCFVVFSTWDVPMHRSAIQAHWPDYACSVVVWLWLWA